MFSFRIAALTAGLALSLVGCARLPLSQSIKGETLAAMQPIEVKVGIQQPELYAAFVRSEVGAGGAVACGVVPGIGILLAAACGGALGAVDASVNAARAKTTDEMVRPLKDELLNINFDKLMSESLTRSLESVPGVRIANVAVTKSVDHKANEEAFVASTSGSTMFVHVNYHLSTDMSVLEVSARGLIYPRSASARTAAGFPATLTPTSPNESAMAAKNASYRSNIIYRAKLPAPGKDLKQNVAAWKMDDALLLRAALIGGIAQSTRLLAEDLQRKPGAEMASMSTAKIDVGDGIQADVVRQGDSGSLARHPNGSLYFIANLSAAVTAFSATPAASNTSVRTSAAANATAVERDAH